MNKLTSIICDSSGQLSSTRVGKLVLIGCWGFSVVMHVLDPVGCPETSMTLTAAVLGAMGISTAQKAVEKK